MSVSISSKDENQYLELSYSDFFKIRNEIAYQLSKSLGDCYKKIMDGPSPSLDDDLTKEASKVRDDCQDVVEFIFASDCGGMIDSETCGKVFQLLKNIEFDDPFKFKDIDKLIALCFYCYMTSQPMLWH